MIKGIVFDIWGVLVKDSRTLNDEVKETLEILKRDYSLSVATSVGSAKMQEVLDRFEISNYFDAKSSSSDVVYSKPSADVYLRSIELMGLEPEECVVIDDGADNLIDIGRAGAKTFLMGEDLTKMSQLPNLIKKL
jgi:HAD superfamily hydrolase (TIGR01509 family)